MCIQTRWKIWWFDVNIHCVIIILIKLIAIPITTTYIIGWIHLRKQVEMQNNTPGLSGLSKELHGIYFISGSERYSVGLLCFSSLQLDCLRKDRSISLFTLKSLWKGKSYRDRTRIGGWQELLCCEKGWKKKTQENLGSSEIISQKLDLYTVYHTCCYTFVHNHSKLNTKTESFKNHEYWMIMLCPLGSLSIIARSLWWQMLVRNVRYV